MTLREKQSLFIRLLGLLITWAYASGYELTGKELLRTKQQALANAASGAGIARSLHLLGLAIDLEVFKDGQLAQTVEGFRPLGEYWKGLHPLCRWGGDFRGVRADGTIGPKPDADHFSLEHEGIQ